MERRDLMNLKQHLLLAYLQMQMGLSHALRLQFPECIDVTCPPPGIHGLIDARYQSPFLIFLDIGLGLRWPAGKEEMHA